MAFSFSGVGQWVDCASSNLYSYHPRELCILSHSRRPDCSEVLWESCCWASRRSDKVKGSAWTGRTWREVCSKVAAIDYGLGVMSNVFLDDIRNFLILKDQCCVYKRFLHSRAHAFWHLKLGKSNRHNCLRRHLGKDNPTETRRLVGKLVNKI